ncbi:hypothetical protein N431DRAFT_542266 [Stipitochalara longipes BDJ]|nr:hypothetical protein N431DRAFT_542266 [Stipitochalara longipes BDJ]
MPTIPVDVQQTRKPWPGYFLVRTTGEVVPLIAVDELPPSIELMGVPRSLDLEETIGMLNLGLQRSTRGFYQIALEQGSKIPSSEAVVPSKSPEGSSRTSSFPSPKATAATISRTLANPPASPAATQLCRHWCVHGICKWGQQCRYRHIMPMTVHGLHEVGLQDWPIWFRKENPGYFVSDARVAGVPARIGRARRILGNGAGASACCGNVHAVDGGRAERLRGSGRVTVRERVSGRVLKSEELGEQIIARLRGMSKEGRAVGEKAVGAHGGNAKIERAAARDTKNWENESDEEYGEAGTSAEEDAKSIVHGKLVDV